MTFRERIIERLKKNHYIDKGGCYIWTGHIDVHGYGSTSIENKIQFVHRLSAYIFMNFNLDPKITVRHSCKNRHCFNPEHLFIKPE